MKPDADVYQGSTLVAHLSRTGHGTVLEFLPGVPLERESLATSLPRSEEPVESPDLHPFFLNLLPEGERLRLLLEAARSKDDSLELLLKLGWDTIGDVSVLPHGRPIEARPASAFQSTLGDVSFWDLFYEGIRDTADAAVPGVQAKISASTVAFGVRVGSGPSGILKLNPKNYPLLVQNEAFFLHMANACGLRANAAQLVQDKHGESGLLVTRFDRVKHGRSLRKLHQEDACQLLDVVPARKYRVSMRSIAEALTRHCSAPVVEIDRLMAHYAFSYLIGNSDLHAKNVSILWDGVATLAPAYDLLSTLPYPNINQRMALGLDGRDDRFRAKHFASFAAQFRVPERATLRTIGQLCQRAEPWLERLDEIGFDRPTTARLRAGISRRISNLLR